MPTHIDWAQAIRPLLRKYKNSKHPLNDQSVYQLLVMVVLSAQSTDEYINRMAPGFFSAFPDLKTLAKASPQVLFPHLHGVRNFAHKANWLIEIAQQIRTDNNIPLSMDQLVALPGIGRKSANVILR